MSQQPPDYRSVGLKEGRRMPPIVRVGIVVAIISAVLVVLWAYLFWQAFSDGMHASAKF